MREAKRNIRRHKPKTYIECRHCGQRFARRGRQLYCDDTCRYAYHNEQRRIRRKSKRRIIYIKGAKK